MTILILVTKVSILSTEFSKKEYIRAPSMHSLFRVHLFCDRVHELSH